MRVEPLACRGGHSHEVAEVAFQSAAGRQRDLSGLRAVVRHAGAYAYARSRLGVVIRRVR